MNERLGTKEGELATMRNECTKELARNRDLDLQADQLLAENNGL